MSHFTLQCCLKTNKKETNLLRFKLLVLSQREPHPGVIQTSAGTKTTQLWNSRKMLTTVQTVAHFPNCGFLFNLCLFFSSSPSRIAIVAHSHVTQDMNQMSQ